MVVNTNIFRHLIFGGVDSADYGVYINGDAVYNAPERVVEFVDVPGRNGAIALDQGRYNNIEITYPAGTFAKTQEEFRENLSNFRNAILSQKGYQRLEDTYHPEEFRMAVYTAGLEVDPVNYNQAGEFELVFNCKPQRWLTVGEYPIPVESGDVLENPTPFDSGPLLEILGYGQVSFNGYDINVTSDPMGEVILISPVSKSMEELTSASWSSVFDLAPGLMIAGDEFVLPRGTSLVGEIDIGSSAAFSISSPTITSTSGVNNTDINTGGGDEAYGGVYQGFVMTEASSANDINFVYGTQKTVLLSVEFSFQIDGATKSYNWEITISYDGADSIEISHHMTATSGSISGSLTYFFYTGIRDAVKGMSSVPVWGKIYIDCNIGEAYKNSNGEYISLNQWIAFGSDLPVLAPGINTIIFDNTITELKIIPRWWRV